MTIVVCASAVACDPEGSTEIEGAPGDGDGPDEAPGDEGDALDVPLGEPDGDVFLRNRVALDMDVTIRPLDVDDPIDCAAIAEDPGALPLDAFAPGRVETLSPHAVTVVLPHVPGEQECYAAWVQSDGLGARILFWWDGDPPPRVAPDDCCSDGPGIVQLIPTDDGWSLHLIGDTRLVYTPGA